MNVEYCQKCDYPVEKCQCGEIAERMEKMRLARTLRETEALGGALAMRMFTLEGYDNRAAIAECAEFPQLGLFLFGPTGSGKTHLATALVRQQPGGRVIKLCDILRSIRAAENARRENEIIKALATGPLVIDDLGMEKMTEFAVQTIDEICDNRIMADCGGLIITSNYGLNALALKIGERSASRINGMCKVVKISGEDRRIKKSQEDKKL